MQAANKKRIAQLELNLAMAQKRKEKEMTKRAAISASLTEARKKVAITEAFVHEIQQYTLGVGALMRAVRKSLLEHTIYEDFLAGKPMEMDLERAG